MKPRIVVVDDEDNIIGYKLREDVDAENLRYRITSLWITNSKGEFLLARRTHTKSHNPRMWGPAVAGTVDEGESYEDNIIKEAEEELGLKNIKIKKGPKIKRDGKHKSFSQRFTCVLDKPIEEFKIQEEEVAEIKWFSREELRKSIQINPDEFLDSVKMLLD
ncbi:MAG: NUDIX domain-containing protein [Nanoarchaeota archaeon]|nr:NUDIX domain-containing protein [Nanoarchaeota archaeon]MBU1854176.1 NUDIX domain-containing protein [Nanoarchaeota archaeon]